MKKVVVVVAVAGICLSAGYAIGQEQAKRTVVVAQEVRLVDRQGKTRALFALNETDDSPSLSLYDANGIAKAQLRLTANGRVVTKEAQTGIKNTDDDNDLAVPTGLELLNVKVSGSNKLQQRLGAGGCEIKAEIKNNRTASVDSIFVTANFYDNDGKVIDNTIATTASLGTGETWKFSLVSTKNNVAKGRITSVRAY